MISTVLKTPAAKRDIPIPKCLVDCLRETKENSISDYVIADSKGEPLAASQFQRVWQYVVVRSTKPRNYYKYVNGQSIKYTVTPTLGMTQKNQPKIRYTLDFDVTPHQLRHTYITNLLYAGVDPKTVQYVTVNEVNSNQKFDLIRKSILSILQTKNAYDIMPVGKKMKVFMRHAKTPVFQHRGFLFHLWQGGLYPRLATSCYFLSSHLQM